MKTKIYMEPAMRVVRTDSNIIATSIPSGINNEYKPGEGLAPENRSIWK